MESSIFLQYTLSHWAVFFSAAVLLTITPGPDLAFILGRTIEGGRQSGFAAMFGIWAGTFVHVVFAIAGLSAIVAGSPVIFSTIKWLGVAYLIYLGISSMSSKSISLSHESYDSVKSNKGVFFQGAIITLLNPKVALFFIAFLPQFVIPDAGPTWFQLLLHGVLLICISALIEPFFVLLGSKLSRTLRNNSRAGVWMSRTLGVLFFSLAARLALESV